MVTPDARSTAVFRSGTEKGLSGWIPVGGHAQPSSGVGASLLWKNAQKNAKKNITSEVINRIIPHRKPEITYVVCSPMYVASRMMSRHHCTIVSAMIRRPSIKHFIPMLWNHAVRPRVRVSAPRDPVRGHGLNSTK